MPDCRSLLLAALALPCVLSGCGDPGTAREREPVLEPDPAIVAALAAPIMTDPDLAALNRGNAAIALDQFDAVPAWTRDPAAIEAARVEAVRLAGGAWRSAPEPGSATSLAAVRSAEQFAARLTGADGRCRDALRHGFAWATDMPRAASLYPGGHAVEAAGARLPDCALRSVRYVTAAAPRDVLDFHFTMLAGEGYRVERASGERADLLIARNGRARAQVLVASGADGMTEVAIAIAI